MEWTETSRGDDGDAERALAGAIASVKESLAGKWRWMVPHGFEVAQIRGRLAVLRLPVIWEPKRGVILAQASERASTANLDEFRMLFERCLQSLGWLSYSRGIEWTARMDEGARPGNLGWTLIGRLEERRA